MFKYIIFEDGGGMVRIIIFDCIVDHSTIKNRMEFSNWRVVSAGKITKGWNCINGSVTLGFKFNLKQSEEDTKTIAKMSEYH